MSSEKPSTESKFTESAEAVDSNALLAFDDLLTRVQKGWDSLIQPGTKIINESDSFRTCRQSVKEIQNEFRKRFL